MLTLGEATRAFSGTREVQGLARSLVELTSDRIELPLREALDGLGIWESTGAVNG